MNSPERNNKRSRARDTAVFAMLGAMMFGTKYLMELLPNIHLLALFIGAITLVYGKRALFPIYIYVFLDGLFHGFSIWWIPYLYIYLPLFFAFLFLPKGLPMWAKSLLYPTLCAVHGLLFGLLYAPCQALFFGLNFEATLAWIASGAVFDLIHCASNAVFGTLVLPFEKLLLRLDKRSA